MIRMGTEVLISERLVRRETPIDGGTFKEWVATPIKKRGALYIGYRTLQNGKVYWTRSDDDDSGWRMTTTLKAALVVLNDRTNPIYVPWDSLKELP